MSYEKTSLFFWAVWGLGWIALAAIIIGILYLLLKLIFSSAWVSKIFERFWKR